MSVPSSHSSAVGCFLAEFDVFLCLLNTAERWPAVITQVHDVLSSLRCCTLCWCSLLESVFSGGDDGNTSLLPTPPGRTLASTFSMVIMF